MAFQFVLMPNTTWRGRLAINSLAAAAKVPVQEYRPDIEFLFLWGAGGASQIQLGEQHRKAGGQVVYLDVGYFHRAEKAFRISFNGFHCPTYLPLGEGRQKRFCYQEVETADLYKEDGHVLLCGTGPKSLAYYGESTEEWCDRIIETVKKDYPDVELRYRPKPGKNLPIPAGCVDGSTGSIREQLDGCRLLVCRHSNAQVDALRYNVPFMAADGIISKLTSPVDRYKTLEAVSWFNWKPEESAQCLEFITEIQKEVVAISGKV